MACGAVYCAFLPEQLRSLNISPSLTAHTLHPSQTSNHLASHLKASISLHRLHDADDKHRRQGLPPFGPVHIIDPQQPHTHTAILLHGRGSDGLSFSDELFSTLLSSNSSLPSQLPSWRWVFPSSKTSWDATFQEYMSSWFEAPSLSDPTQGQDLQIPGLLESSEHIAEIIDGEISRLGGDSGSVMIGGISQGGAVALWILLCSRNEWRIGGAFAASTWLPFAENIRRVLLEDRASDNSRSSDPETAKYDDFIRQAMRTLAADRPTKPKISISSSSNTTKTKIFLGHGSDDAYVDITLGSQARDVLSQAGHDVEWKTYTGAEQEGHWLQEPDEMDDLCRFMQSFMA